MAYQDANPVAAAAFAAAVRARDSEKAKKLVDETYPEALWGAVLRTLSKQDHDWAQRVVVGYAEPSEPRRSARSRKAAPPRERGTDLERRHGHCADQLMKDYGVPKHDRTEICSLIQDIWRQGSMVHSVIIQSVQGYIPEAEHRTMTLKQFLERRRTKPPPAYYKR